MRALLLVSLVMASACASSGSSSPEAARPISESVRLNGGVAGSLNINPSSSAASTVVPFSMDQVWRILPSVFDSLGIPIGVLDPAIHQVGNAGYKLRRQLGGVPLSRYFNCGETQIGPNADSYDIYLTAMATLTAEADGTTSIATVMDASARPAAFSQAYAHCTTKGELENRLLDGVKRRLQR